MIFRALVLFIFLFIPAWCYSDGSNVNPGVSYNNSQLSTVFKKSSYVDSSYWKKKPRLPDTYGISQNYSGTRADTSIADNILSGIVKPSFAHPERTVGFPPDWASDPFHDEYWRFSLYTLRWVLPLYSAYENEKNDRYFLAIKSIIADFVTHIGPTSKEVPEAWGDHAVANRAKVLCWFFEKFRTSKFIDDGFMALLLTSIHQHAIFLSDPRNYSIYSNHGLECIGSVIGISLEFPEFKESDTWEKTALDQLQEYIKHNVSSTGFHKEQSPQYHWYVYERLIDIRKFLQAYNVTDQFLDETVTKLAINYPLFLMPNGDLPIIGDTPKDLSRQNWESIFKSDFGAKSDYIISQIKNRPERIFFVEKEVGYTFFETNRFNAIPAKNDLYIIFRNNNFEWTHAHADALSFILYGLGRNWIVDSGYYTYNDGDIFRKYFESRLAHNVIVPDDKDAPIGTTKLIDYGYEKESPFVVSEFTSDNLQHRRRFKVNYPNEIDIDDTVRTQNHEKVKFSQLFHLPPDLSINIINSNDVVISDNHGNTCHIHQIQKGFSVKVIKGQTNPYIQGWYSELYGQKAESPVVIFYNDTPSESATFKTTITLSPAISN